MLRDFQSLSFALKVFFALFGPKIGGAREGCLYEVTQEGGAMCS